MGLFGNPKRIPKSERAQPKQETREEARERKANEKRTMARKRNQTALRQAQARKRATKNEDVEVEWIEVTVDKWGRESYKRHTL